MSLAAMSNQSYWPAADGAAPASHDDDDDYVGGDVSQVKSRSPWALSTGRHSGMPNFLLFTT